MEVIRQMATSMYVDPYLDEMDSRERAGKAPLTAGTFLAYRLRGKAKEYIGRYEDALVRGLRQAGAVEVRSAGGGLAFRRQQAAQ